MATSAARIAANQRNAARSTGPRSVEGKEIARRNALKHGLTAQVVPVEAAAAVAERAMGVHAMLNPRNAWQVWLGTEIATITVRLDRLAAIEQQVRAGAAWRALTFWDEDQRQEAERIGAGLGRNPGRVVGQLRRSPQGCDWLIERWTSLAAIAQLHPWSAEQTELANNMLGTPRDVRDDAFKHQEDVDPAVEEAELARGVLADLQDHRARVVEADEIARSLAAADLNDLNNRDLGRLRRYERDLQTQLHRYFQMSQLASAPSLSPVPPLAQPRPEPSPPPPTFAAGTNPTALPVPAPGTNPTGPSLPAPETNPTAPPVEPYRDIRRTFSPEMARLSRIIPDEFWATFRVDERDDPSHDDLFLAALLRNEPNSSPGRGRHPCASGLDQPPR